MYRVFMMNFCLTLRYFTSDIQSCLTLLGCTSDINFSFLFAFCRESSQHLPVSFQLQEPNSFLTRLKTEAPFQVCSCLSSAWTLSVWLLFHFAWCSFALVFNLLRHCLYHFCFSLHGVLWGPCWVSQRTQICKKEWWSSWTWRVGMLCPCPLMSVIHYQNRPFWQCIMDLYMSTTMGPGWCHACMLSCAHFAHMFLCRFQ